MRVCVHLPTRMLMLQALIFLPQTVLQLTPNYIGFKPLFIFYLWRNSTIAVCDSFYGNLTTATKSSKTCKMVVFGSLHGNQN